MHPKKITALLLTLFCLVLSGLIGQNAASADLKEAVTLYRNGKYNAALEELDQTTSAGPEEAKINFMRGQVFLAKYQPDAAIIFFKRSLEDEAFILRDYADFSIAKCHQTKQQLKEAIAAYEDFIISNPSSTLIPDAFVEIGQCYAEMGQFESAIINYKKVLKEFPNSYLVDQSYYLIGEAYEKMGNTKKAVAVYQNLNQEKPLGTYVNKAFARLEALSKTKKIPSSYLAGGTTFSQGMRLFQSRRYKEAENVFKQIVRTSPKSKWADDALVMIGRCEYRRGRASKSIQYFNQAISYNGNAADEAYYYKGYAYALLGNNQRAIAAYNIVVKKYPKSPLAPEAQYYVGFYYESEKMASSAVNAYSHLLNKFPQSDWADDASFRLGTMHYKNGNHIKSSAAFSHGAEVDPPGNFSERCLYWMAKSEEKQGNQQTANELYQKLAQRYDHSYFSYRARDTLSKQGINIEAKTVELYEEELPLVYMVPEKQADVIERQEILDIWGNLGVKGKDASVNSKLQKEDHRAKYNALMQLGMSKYAAKEAAEIVVKSPVAEKNDAKINLGMALLSAGEYSTPIHFADEIVKDSILKGNSEGISYYTWQLAYPRGYWYEVSTYAKKYGVDPFLILAIIREESRFRTSASSRAYAMGLMQIIPRTGRGIARFLGISPYSTAALHNPSTNIYMGTYYISHLLERFNGNMVLALAAYNGGPNRVSKWQKKWIAEKGSNYDIDEFVEAIPLRETRYYVQKVLNSYYEYKRLYGRKG